MTGRECVLKIGRNVRNTPNLNDLSRKCVVQLEVWGLTMGMLYDLVVQEGRCHQNYIIGSWEIIWCVDGERSVVVVVNTEDESERRCWRGLDKGYRSEGHQEVIVEWGKW